MRFDGLINAYNRAWMLSEARTFYDLLKFRNLRSRYYSELWRTAASSVGAKCTEWQDGFFQISRAGMTTVVAQSRVMLDDQLTLNIMGNKALTYDLLETKGYKIPAHCLYTMAEFSKAEDFFHQNPGPYVVKPASGTGGGRGVTTGIRTPAQLKRASKYAAKFGSRLLLEEQVSGSSYRLLYLDGKFIDAVRRDPPRLTGDGKQSIRHLIRAENLRRLDCTPVTALSPLVIDRDCRNRLAEQGLSTRSVPNPGVTFEVKRAANENSASENHNVRKIIDPSIVKAGSSLALALGVKLAGIDLICTNISIPLADSGGIISEINTTPAIHHHYLISNPDEKVPVAEVILDHLFTSKQGVMNLRRIPELVPA